jgi:dihydroxyacid dehydratase/phosphogluconate dehydratase
MLVRKDGINPDQVIYSPEAARKAGLTSTVVFPTGNLAPEGSVIKATAIDPKMVGPDGFYRHTGPARVFVTERAAIEAVKNGGVKAGDTLVLICRGPLGSGMEETYQITSALKHLPWGKQVALITDARFSGVSTGACIGHVGPEALAGGPVGKLLDGDLIQIIIDTRGLVGTVNLVAQAVDPADQTSIDRGNQLLSTRKPRIDLACDPLLPDDTRLWALLQQASGGTWGGCVYDVDAIARKLNS